MATPFTGKLGRLVLHNVLPGQLPQTEPRSGLSEPHEPSTGLRAIPGLSAAGTRVLGSHLLSWAAPGHLLVGVYTTRWTSTLAWT